MSLDEAVLGNVLSYCKTINNKLDSLAERTHGIVIINIFIGGAMNFDKVNAAVSKNTTVGEVFGTIYPAIAEAIRAAKGDQAKLDALASQLESANTIEETRVAALKDLITPPPPTLAAVWNGPQTATVGESFQGAVAADGGTAPYTFTINDQAALPPGLSFNPDGSVSGIPGTAGTFSFSGAVTDTAGGSASWSASITVS